ncbi:MAG: Cof-type HAD-IIB family hydrolase [Erysipelotrichaceae bacterium]
MLKHIIASDLDGTLLNKKSEVSKTTETLMNQFIDQGHIFVTCTSRSFTGLPVTLENIHFRYSICNNGAAIYDHQLQNIVASFQLATAHIRPILEIDLPFIKSVTFVHQGIVYSLPILLDIFRHYGFSEEKLSHTQQTRVLTEDILEKLDQLEFIDKLHFNFYTNKERNEFLKRIPQSPYYNLAASSEENIEITATDASKGKALLHLAKLLELENTPILSFGDNLNDLPLFEVATKKIALSNAVEALKDEADYITSFPCDEDGEVLFLQDYFESI